MTPDIDGRLTLANLFLPSGLLADYDGDGLPEMIRARLVLGSGANLPEHCAAVDFAARLAFESMAVQLPLLECDPPGLAADRIACFIGRPGTLALLCPASFVTLVDGLDPGDGVVATLQTPCPSLLVAGGDGPGLAAAVRALVTGLDTLAAGDVRRDDGTEVLHILAATSTTVLSLETGHAMPPLRSLADLFGPGGLSLDTDGDLLPDQMRAVIVIPDDLSAAEAAALAHLGARLGLESLGASFPLAIHAGDLALSGAGGARIVVEPLSNAQDTEGEGTIRLQTPATGPAIRVAGSGQGRLAALEALAALDAWSLRGRPALADVERSLHRLFALAGPMTTICALLPAIQSLPAELEARAALPRHIRQPLHIEVNVPARWPVEHEVVQACARQWLHTALPDDPCGVLVGAAEAAELLCETTALTWEVDEAWQTLRSSVLPAIAALPEGSDAWFLDIRLSEPSGRRAAMRRLLLREIRASGRKASDTQVRILPVYHQGRAWILEELLPSIVRLPVARILIRVQSFVVDTPSLELPIRWLQDLFPVDELLAERLNLPLAAIDIVLVDDLPETYDVVAKDVDGNVLMQRGFNATFVARRYLQPFPEWGMVHPATGCVRLELDGSPIVDVRVRTDPERVWDHVQESLLPRLAAEIGRACNGLPRRELQPFFGELAIDVWLSEEDEAIGVREERSSPLESLHEDLYFMLLDYCTALISSSSAGDPYLPPWIATGDPDRFRRNARSWTAPGLIVPRIHRHDGAAGRLLARLTAAEPGCTATWRRGDVAGELDLRAAPAAEARIAGIDVKAGGSAPCLLLTIDGPAADREQAQAILSGWADLAAASPSFPDLGMPVGWSLDVIPDAGTLDGRRNILHARGMQAQEPAPGPDSTTGPLRKGPAAGSAVPGAVGPFVLTGVEEADVGAALSSTVPLDRVLSRAEVEASISRLGRLPGVHVYRAGRSARGRDVVAVEVTVPRGTGWWSRAKMSGWKCTLLLNGRHHANEPSSTGALLRLIQLLGSDDNWRRYLQRVNVVVVPAENVDGMDVYDELRAEHPTWMLHAARYNASGLEYAAAYGDAATRHTEAMVLPSVWSRWAPDVVCDNHGFPSHVWEQLFSGQCSPWYQAFWIPQCLIYAYVPSPTPERYPEHAGACSSIAQRLVEAIADDHRLAIWNGDHAERYRTHLQSRLPDRFPAPYDRDVLINKGTYDPESGDAGLAGFPGLHPGVTTCSMVTEVADETAQGDYLTVCSAAHLLADRALLQYLFDAAGPASVRRGRAVRESGRVVLRATRARPVTSTQYAGSDFST